MTLYFKKTGSIFLPSHLNTKQIQKLFRALDARGITARFVGGCVRDILIRKIPIDIDFAVNADPISVTEALEAEGISVFQTGIKHGTVTARVGYKNEFQNFELTTLRKDVVTDGRHAEVEFTGDWMEDAKRRDFTFNAIYLDKDGNLYDPFNGGEDLLKKVVRFIGNPSDRINEDVLRIFRFFRFNARLLGESFISRQHFGRSIASRGVRYDADSFEACERNVEKVLNLSAERVRDELFKILKCKSAASIIDTMNDIGLFRHWMPEFYNTYKLSMLSNRELEPDPLRRLAAILKPHSGSVVAGRLRMSNDQKNRLKFLTINNSTIPVGIGPQIWRQYIYTIGPELFVDKLMLSPDHPQANDAIIYASHWVAPDKPFNGHDVVDLVKPEKIKSVLDETTKFWRLSDFTASREQCLEVIRKLSNDD